MGRITRGKRDGTGSYKNSYQQKKYGKGKRQREGVKCPKR